MNAGYEEIVVMMVARSPVCTAFFRAGNHPGADEADVGKNAVLSADVGDAPMRQRQYTASVPRPCVGAVRHSRGLAAIRSHSVDQQSQRSIPPRECRRNTRAIPVS